MANARWVRIRGALREFFWLDRRLGAATDHAFGPGHAGWSEFVFARATLRQADVINAARGDANPAVLLYRTAARLVLRAELRRRGATGDQLEADDHWQSFMALPKSGAPCVQMSEERLGLIALGLGPHGESVLAGMPRERAYFAGTALRELCLLVGAPLAKEVAEVRRIVGLRWLRIAFALAVVGTAACMLVVALTNHQNFALHRPVNVAAIDPGYADTARLVDGDRTNLGFHSSGQPHVVTIDLGRPQRISKIVIYNRTDCCEERALPLRIELAQGDEFRSVAERKTVFRVWRAAIPTQLARYVRLSTTNTEPFHLSEVEVY